MNPKHVLHVGSPGRNARHSPIGAEELPLTVRDAVVADIVLPRFLAPGDPARLMLGESATPEAIQALRADWGLDRPKLEQYTVYMGKVCRLDLGRSYKTGDQVIGEILTRFPATAELAVYSMLIASSFGDQLPFRHPTTPEVVETVIVVEPEPVTEAGLKPALAFAGRPATVKVAAPVSPVDAVTVTVKFVLPPGITVPVLGVAARLKSGVTVKVAAVVCWSEPFVPVIVNGKTPAATDAVVAMVSVVVPVEVRVVGLKVAVAPDGNPEVPNVTVEL